MTPLKLTLRNFTGIRSGLGRDEITLDIAAMTAGAQLVALVGPNGMGKSTLLDNLQPYRFLPSRAGSYSPGAFSFYDHISGPEAYKELEWEHEGRHYRTSFVFKTTGKTKKTEAYLHAREGDQWSPVTLPDGSVSDGKTDTYDRVVAHLLGSPETFFSSVFAAQGRRSLSSYSNGEIKTLLSDLLGLDRILDLGGKASQTAKLLRAHLDGMRITLSRADAAEHARAQASTDLDAARASATEQERARAVARQGLAAATARLADLQVSVRANAEIEIRRDSLRSKLDGITQRLRAGEQQIEHDLREEIGRRTQITERYEAESARLSGEIDAHRRRIMQGESLLARRGEIRTASERRSMLDAETATAEQAAATARTALDARRILATRIDQVRASLTTMARDGSSAAEQCAALRRRAALTGEVPCGGTDLQGRCQLLADAVVAAAGIPAAETKAQSAREEYARTQEGGKRLAAELASMADPAPLVEAAESTLRRLHSEANTVHATAALAGALDSTEESITHAQAQIVSIQRAIDTLAVDVRAAVADAEQREAGLKARRGENAAGAEQERAEVQAELDRLPPPADTSAIEAAEAAVEMADKALAAADVAVAELTARIATAEERRRSAERELAAAGTARARAAQSEQEIAHWTALSKALSPDGIVALSIDDAGPTLTGIANDLLLACYGPRFSIALRTQEQTQKGDMRETFDVVVFDAERDDEKSVRAMSGGEKVWINECVTRAIALYQAQLSGRQYHTLFADESDGALDPERKQMFLAMKRKVLELGGYKQEFFVSHARDLWESADAVIDMKELRG